MSGVRRHRASRSGELLHAPGVALGAPAACGLIRRIRHARVRVRSVDVDWGILDARARRVRRFPDPVAPPVVAAPPGDPAGHTPIAMSCRCRRDTGSPGNARSRSRSRLLRCPGVTLDQVRGDGEANLGWWSGSSRAACCPGLVGGQARGATPLLMATVILFSGGDVDAVADLRCPRREASSPSHGAPEGASGGRH